MAPGQSSLSFVSMIEECRSFLCSKEYHTLQYVVLSNEVENVDLVGYPCSKEDHTLQYFVLSNEVGLNHFLSILFFNICLFFEDQGSKHWEFDITNDVVF
jgi:hypothetical protein